VLAQILEMSYKNKFMNMPLSLTMINLMSVEAEASSRSLNSAIRLPGDCRLPFSKIELRIVSDS
jgi:hypothetical protein